MREAITIFLTLGAIWITSSVGITVFILYKVLNKYNNFGDSTGDIRQFSVEDIEYSRYIDEVSEHEITMFNDNYGSNPYEGIKRSVPEPLLKDNT